MSKNILSIGLCLGILTSSSLFFSCKDKNPEETENTTISTSDNNVNTAPVEISSDAQLEQNVKDAVKDYPGVTATVANGEVTLTGTIARDDLSRLMPTVQSLNPKKVNNNLTIQ